MSERCKDRYEVRFPWRRGARMLLCSVGRIAVWGTLTGLACGMPAAPVSRPAGAVAAPPGSRPVATPESPPQVPLGADPGPACARLQVDVPGFATHPLNPDVPPIQDPEHHTMAPFYERLARLLRGKATEHVRLAFYGDSNMTLDLISGSMRRALQKLHGDGGHGYVAVGKPWRWYDHLDVEHDFVGEWATFSPSTVRVRDMAFGLGGIVSATREPGARAMFGTAANADAPVGRTASRFGVFYAHLSKGGVFEMRVDGQVRARVDTAQGQGLTGYHVVQVDDAPHRFEVVNAGKKLIRIFGATLERDAPGVVLDSLGIGGISYFDLARLDEATNLSMLGHRPYDLVMFLIGANTWKASENPGAVARLVQLHRKLRADQPLLVMSPPDHAKSIGDSESDPQFVRIAEKLAQAARDNRCAFWDFRLAMGGDGSMVRFFHANLAAKDLYHFTRGGAAFMAERIVHALFRDFASYLEQNPRAGCDGTGFGVDVADAH